MSEKTVQLQLRRAIEALGGEVRKMAWEGRRNAPDYMVLLPPLIHLADPWLPWVVPRVRILFTENKTEGAAFPRNAHERAQEREHRVLRFYGQHVFIIDGKQSIEALVKWLCA